MKDFTICIRNLVLKDSGGGETSYHVGSFVLSSVIMTHTIRAPSYQKALIKKAFDRAFEKYDMIIGPAAPTTAELARA